MYGAGDDGDSVDDVDQNNTKKKNKQGNKKCDNKCNKHGSGSFSQIQSLVSQRSVYGINPVQARGESFVVDVICVYKGMYLCINATIIPFDTVPSTNISFGSPLVPFYMIGRMVWY